MPSLVLGQPLASGPQILISGNPWSGRIAPQGLINLRWVSSGGNAYVGMSGNMTITSGGMQLSGGVYSGLSDGMLLAPGDSITYPKIGCGASGSFNLWALCDVNASGIGRMFVDVF